MYKQAKSRKYIN